MVDVDLERFFDRVNHDILMGKLAKRIEDKRVLRLIRRYLGAGVMVNGVVDGSPAEEAGLKEGDVILKYDVLGKKYQVVRVVNKKAESLGDFAVLEDASGAVEAPYKTTISLPKKGQRGYYNLLLDVETLSLSDLDEVERWLRGELKPAVSGKKNPGTALGRGVRTLVVRLLGGEKRHYEARTGAFRL